MMEVDAPESDMCLAASFLREPQHTSITHLAPSHPKAPSIPDSFLHAVIRNGSSIIGHKSEKVGKTGLCSVGET